MFCNDNFLVEKNDLLCSKRLLSEILSLISLSFSIFTVFVSFKKLKMNITNILIIHIIISEILDSINVLTAIFFDIIGRQTFENYRTRMNICFFQIFIGVFTCLWTLFSCFFISLRIYDRMQNKNRIFRTKFMANFTTVMSYAIPLIMTYILWAIQITNQANKISENDLNSYYPDKEKSNDYFRHMYCWVTGSVNWSLFFITIILIILNLYFSIVKSALFIKKVSNEMIDTEEDIRESIQVKIRKMNRMMYSLIIYPITSAILWVSFFVIQFLFNLKPDEKDGKDGSFKNGPLAWIYCSIISLRQFIYTSVFFWTQSSLRKYTLGLFSCNNSKSNNSSKHTSFDNELN